MSNTDKIFYRIYIACITVVVGIGLYYAFDHGLITLTICFPDQCTQ